MLMNSWIQTRQQRGMGHATPQGQQTELRGRARIPHGPLGNRCQMTVPPTPLLGGRR